MTKSFTISIEEKHGCLWITFKDAIDMDNYKSIEDSLFTAITMSPIQNVVCDLSQTVALFSSGIGVIMRMNKIVSDNAKKLHFVNVSEKVQEGLEIMGLDNILNIYTSNEAFQAALNKLTK